MTGQCKAGLLVKYEVKAYQYEPKASHLLLLCRFLQLLPAPWLQACNCHCRGSLRQDAACLLHGLKGVQSD